MNALRWAPGQNPDTETNETADDMCGTGARQVLT